MLIFAYYRGAGKAPSMLDGWSGEPLLRAEYLASAELAVRDFFSSMSFEQDLATYIDQPHSDAEEEGHGGLVNGFSRTALVSVSSDKTSSRRQLFGCFLTFYEIPPPTEVRNGFQRIASVLASMPSSSSTTRQSRRTSQTSPSSKDGKAGRDSVVPMLALIWPQLPPASLLYLAQAYWARASNSRN